MKCDVLVIGSGAAGLRTAIQLKDNKVDVLVVGKCKKRDAHTILATGGINAALGTMDRKDTWQAHAADTIKDGGFLNDPIAVKILCKEAPARVKELAKWGCDFHKEKNGKLTQRFFGAARYRRACFSGDQTGKAILNTLVDQAEKRKIRFKSELYIFSLLHHRGKVNGAVGLELSTGKIVPIHAKKVVLATGGHSKMYSRSSSRFWENNGDGIGLAAELKATFMDMELFQFHPTGMLHPKKAAGVLVTEAVRGEGGLLFNKKNERFMKRYDKKRMELSARDTVALAIYTEVQRKRGTRHGGVYLDISHKPLSYIKKRLPKMYRQFKKYAGIDISKQRMEVGPTAHYSMGGIQVDPKTGTTTVPNLYAVGEVTSGVHGGNRLGGNSLAECVVFGKIIGDQITKDLKKSKPIPISTKLLRDKANQLEGMLSKSGRDPIIVKMEIMELMWKHAGLVRSRVKLEQGLRKIQKYKSIKLKTGKTLKANEKLIAALDIQMMLPTCEMILKSALHRKESRRAHIRSDFPKTLKSWKKNILAKPTSKGIKISTKPVPKIPNEIKRVLLKDDVEAKLLE